MLRFSGNGLVFLFIFYGVELFSVMNLESYGHFYFKNPWECGGQTVVESKGKYVT